MILVDTSVWADHLRSKVDFLSQLLSRRRIKSHPFVVGEIALGSMASRRGVLAHLSRLPMVPVASPLEVMHLIEERQIYGRGIGYVDVHLLASCLLETGTLLWTRDKRLQRVAATLGLSYDPSS